MTPITDIAQLDPDKQIVAIYTLDAAGQCQLHGTYTEPGPMQSGTLPDLAIDWQDIFTEQP